MPGFIRFPQPFGSAGKNTFLGWQRLGSLRETLGKGNLPLAKTVSILSAAFANVVAVALVGLIVPTVQLEIPMSIITLKQSQEISDPRPTLLNGVNTPNINIDKAYPNSDQQNQR